MVKKELSRALVRYAIAIVFLWFSFQHFTETEKWVGLIPGFLANTFGANNLVLFKGVVDFIFGALLLLGIFTRVSALILSIDLLLTTIVVGYGPTGVRDFGLLLATISIFLGGEDKLCLRKKKKKKSEQVSAGAEPKTTN